MLEQIFLTDGYLHRLFCTPLLKAARPYGWTRLAVMHHGIFHLHSEIGWALSLFAEQIRLDDLVSYFWVA